MRLFSAGSARSTEDTSSTTVVPARMVAPLVPTVVLFTVAVNLSPTSAESVHARSLIVIPILLPVPITPAAGPGFAAAAGVGCVAAGAGGVGRGVRRTGAGGSSRFGVGRGARARGGSGFGAGAAFVGAALVVPLIGASLNTVCGGAWRCANAMSRANAESATTL